MNGLESSCVEVESTDKEKLVTSNSNKSVACCATIDNNVFFKGCKWSPDEIENRILTCDGNNKLTVFHSFLNKLDFASSQFSYDKYELSHLGIIYDFQWYPSISISQYFVIVATSLGPIHIYDISTSRSIAAYQMYNTNDEMTHSHSVACSPDGGTLIGGTADYLFLFDVNRPGSCYTRISTRPHFKRGIISTISINPQLNSMFAVGSYNNRIGIYDGKDLLCLLLGHKKGISQVQFSPDGLLLYSGTRGNGEIICWDLRNPGKALYKLERKVETQQRIYFDITPDCRYILSGSTSGDVYIWDSLLPPVENILPPVHTFKAHEDCTNGLSVHRNLPFFVTVSGQYHFPNFLASFEDVSCNEEENDILQQNSLKLWYLDDLK